MTATTYLEAAGLALLPTLIWGYFFISRNPESWRLVLVTFLMGTLAVVPVLLFMGELGIQLHVHQAAASRLGDVAGATQVPGVLAFFAGLALVLFGVVRLFRLISRRIPHQPLRLGAMLVAAVLLLLASFSYDQLRTHLGPAGLQVVDLFHFLVVFSLVLFLLERFSGRWVVNVVAAGLVAIFAVVAINFGDRVATGNEVELGSVSTMFALPFLLAVVQRGPLTLEILSFLQVYLMFAVMAISALLVVALVHVVYLLHERTVVKVLHVASLVFFAAPFVVRAVATVSPQIAPVAWVADRPGAVAALWYVNLVLLAALSAWSVYQFARESGAAGLGLFVGLYEEPMNFLGVGVVLTALVAVLHWLGLSVVVFGFIFLAFAEEYCKHLVVRFADDESIRSVDDAIVFSIVVGLAFAFAENVMVYFPRFLADQNVPLVYLRSTLTVLMHAVASGLFGYFYGLAHFSSEEVRSGHGGRNRLYRTLHRLFLFRRESLYHEAKMFEGLVLAGAFHATFNLAAAQGRIGIMLAVVGGGGAALYYLLGLKANRQRLGHIAAERVMGHATGRLRG